MAWLPIGTLLAEAGGAGDFFVNVLAMALGGAGGWFLKLWFDKATSSNIQKDVDTILGDARREAEGIKQRAEIDAGKEVQRRRDDVEKDLAAARAELKEAERKLERRGDVLDQKLATLDSKERNLETREKAVTRREGELTELKTQADEHLAKQKTELLRVGRITETEARETLFQRLDAELEREVGAMVAKRVAQAEETAEEKARELVTVALQRYSAGHTAETTVAAVDIPGDEMKGRIIGREGRNIRAFEKVTGVDVIVDDTPGVVVVSSFDPVRREVARLTLERLITDGRIHPARIEEIHVETRKEIDAKIQNLGKKAAMDANIQGLHPKVVTLLGRLHFRTSYSQNVLRHSLEVAYMCQLIADEMGMDGALARRCGLLHDIGKAADHELEGGHPAIGADILKQCKERSEVVNAAAAHHGDVPSTSLYTPIVMAADAISASRPGARRESLDRYIKRLEDLEAVAGGFPGVENVFAVQAGREIRVLVDSRKVDDEGALKMARDIAKAIEEQLTYPGEIRVSLFRETRCVEYAR